MPKIIKALQRGTSMFELMVALTLFSIVALALCGSTGFAYRVQAKTNGSSVAMQIALETLESYVKLDPLTLSAVTNSSSTVSRGTTTYTQVVNITVNTDNSRTINVAVTDDDPVIKSSVSIQGTYTSQSSL